MHLLKYVDDHLTQPYPIPYIAESYNLEWKKLVTGKRSMCSENNKITITL